MHSEASGEAVQRLLQAYSSGSSSRAMPHTASRQAAALRIHTPTEWETQNPASRAWNFHVCAGRLVELSGVAGTPLLSAAMGLVLEAQRAGELVAWIQRAESSFFPPDVTESGGDLASLVVVRIPTPGPAAAGDDTGVAPHPRARGNGPLFRKDAPPAAPLTDARSLEERRRARRHQGAAALARAATRLVRANAFGLVVIDLAGEDAGMHANIPAPLLGKLSQLAQRHDSAVCCLTLKRPEQPSLGSLVSLRGQVRRERTGEDRFACTVRVLKDKRKGPGWTHEEVLHGPPGLP